VTDGDRLPLLRVRGYPLNTLYSEWVTSVASVTAGQPPCQENQGAVATTAAANSGTCGPGIGRPTVRPIKSDVAGALAVPDQPGPSYRRLSRYDETGLIWLLRGRPVLALTASTAAIESPTGTVTVYRRCNKPALGAVGDSLDDLK
jgi:hypothetical protein